jgi:DNA-directed RNA polymerase specialized sigma subunit
MKTPRKKTKVEAVTGLAQDREEILSDLDKRTDGIPSDILSESELRVGTESYAKHLEAVLANPVSRASFARARALRELRHARSLTQADVGVLLDMDQSEVSRLESRSELLVSTLQRYVRATGGQLHLVVTYPETDPIELHLESKRPSE